MNINEAIFRDYDIRGLVGTDLNDEFAQVIGKAFGTYLMRKGTQEVVVGYDARESSPAYFEECVKGLLTTGINVIRVGMITTPMMYWARKYYKIDGGLVVTASHNPPEYNGYKPASGNGALYGEEIQKIKRLMMEEDFEAGKGEVSEKNIIDDYFADVMDKVKISTPLSVIVDCGNSTAGPFAPKLLAKMGVRVTELFCDIDPSFPNHPPDPVDPRAYPQIVELIKKEGQDLGLVFDGDADRLGAIDSEGNIIRGDQITALCARKILKEKPGEKILFEVQCSKSATDDVEAHGGKFGLVRVGHSYIEKALIDEAAALAGETSGHIFFEDRWYGFDDAIYAAARFLEFVSESGQSVKDLVDSLPKYVSTPTTRIFAPDERKFEMIEDLKVYFSSSGHSRSSSSHSSGSGNPKLLTIDGVRLEWEDGWAVIRASNTQPQLTLRAEATTEARLKEIQRLVEESLIPYKSEGVVLEWGKVH